MITKRLVTEHYRCTRRIAQTPRGIEVVQLIYIPNRGTDYSVGVGFPISSDIIISGMVSGRDFAHGHFTREDIYFHASLNEHAVEEVLAKTINVWPAPLSKKLSARVASSLESFVDLRSNLIDLFQRDRETKSYPSALYSLARQGARPLGKELADFIIAVMRLFLMHDWSGLLAVIAFLGLQGGISWGLARLLRSF